MFLPIMKLCVLNQSASYWLLLDALYSTFTLGITMKVDVDKIQAFKLVIDSWGF
jgi:hypothetical protein